MIKKRVIPTLLFKNNQMVKGVKFENFKSVGVPVSTVKVYTSQEADELMFINISDNKDYNNIFLNILKEASFNCSIPLIIGGGIRTKKDARLAFDSGADKILINTSAIENFLFIKELIKIYGSQAIVIGVDYKIINGVYHIFKNNGKTMCNLNFQNYLKKLENEKIGEIFLSNIDLDGSLLGYDFDTLKKIAKELTIPVIGCCGAGNFEHFYEIFSQTEVSALSCSSIFHFGDNNPIRLRSYLKNKNIPVRNIR